ncbi:MAG: hypothetical protein EXQ94_02865 [Alphaproteobacteria bacterium]|nr:hypothetical protein [Alphaproteobacteria bacterium]
MAKMLRNGRSKGEARHIRLYHWLTGSPAWRALKPASKVVLLDVWRRHDGKNNGRIAASSRDIRDGTGLNRRTILAALARCQELGFLTCARPASFTMKHKLAPLWEVTAEPVGDQLATRRFMSWSAPDAGPRPAKFKTRVQKMHRRGAESAPDDKAASRNGTGTGAESAPVKAPKPPLTGAESAPHIVYQGERPSADTFRASPETFSQLSGTIADGARLTLAGEAPAFDPVRDMPAFLDRTRREALH